MEFVYGLSFLLLFSLSAIGGLVLRQCLDEGHFSSENMDAVRLVTGLLVSFAALILSLHLSTSKAAFDAASRDRATYAAHLANLDQCLRNFAPQMEPTRLRLRQYTAAVIISTWPGEEAPDIETGFDTRHMALRGEDAGLTKLMNNIGLAIDSLAPTDATGQNVLARCRAEYGTVLAGRWSVIEDTYAPSGKLFTVVISFWLALVFLSFGLQVQRRVLSMTVLAIGVLCVSTAMFVIIDLHFPYRGVFGISSTPMRNALTDMRRE
ncbi:MAG: hypothetical protein ACOYJQ_16685 [Pseudochelatococcus sp.]|jgi:hypothetical protein|uniref:bestrophin-like domain n=1 Tax=Pseudochelatococcus sp. TaxID=2020869 RepID=UPI003D922566